jgi:hypothetical protein
MAKRYDPFGIVWPLCCLFFFSSIYDSNYPFRIFWPLRCLFFFSSMNGFWLPLWYLLAILLSVILLFDERILINSKSVHRREEQKTQWPKDTKGVIRIRSSKRRRTDNTMAKRFQMGNQNPFIEKKNLISFGHFVVCYSSLRWTDSDYPFGIFWPLSCLFFISSMNGFWLPLSISNIYLKTNQRVIENMWMARCETLVFSFVFGGNHNPFIEEKNRQHNGQKIPKG